MKKLMKTVAAAAVALVASSSFASLPSPEEGALGFEALDADKYTVSQFVTMTDAGESVGSKYWYAITNASQDASAELATIVEGGAASGNKYLSIDARAPLYRTINASGDYGAALSADAEDIPATGIYLDTMVKFSVSSDEFKDGDLDTADKLAITCYSAEESNVTNILVRAGYVDGSSITPTNYVMTLPANFDVDAWHQLTVRAIADVGSSTAPVGFAVYLDQVLLTYGTDVAAGDSTYTVALNPAVTQNLYNSETHALLPSLVTTGVNKSTLTAVGFKGTGSLDNIQFTDEKPDFIVEEVVAMFTADAGVTGISVKVGEDAPIAVDMTADTLTASLPAGTTEFTVTATIDSTYTFARMTYGNGVFNANPAIITDYAGGAIAISTTRNNFNLFDANGDAISGTFETLAQAMAATGVAKIQLAYDYTVAAADIPDGYIDIQQSITIDLNGKTINGGESVSNPLFMVTDGSFVIIDSAGNGKVVYNGPGIVYGATAYIGAASGDFGPTFDGKLFFDAGEGYVIRGKFNETSNTASGDESAFLYLDYLGDGDSVESECTGLVAGYWVVAPKGGSEPTTYAISWTLTGGTTEAAAGDFEENDTIVFTADTGKTLSFVSIDGTEIADTSVYGAGSYTYTVGTADAELVVTFSTPAPTTYAISWTLTGGTTEATAGDFEENDTIVFTAESGKTLSFVSIDGVEDSSAYGASSYTYTVGTADAVLVVTFTGSSYPSYIDDSTKQEKYDTWKSDMAAAGVDVGDGAAYEDAYLLNCKPAEVDAAKAAFKITSISYDTTQEKWVVTYTDGYNERKYNGTVTVKQYSDVGCKTESSTGTFFRATLD